MNYYEVLGIAPGASADEVTDAYLTKAERMNPERFSGDPPDVVSAVKRASVAIEAAWHVLGDPSSRAAYDTGLNAELAPGDQPRLRRLEWRRRHAQHVWIIERNLGLPLTSVLGLGPPGKTKRAPAMHAGLAKEPAPGYSWNDPLAGLVNWLAPHEKRSHQVSVPDVCGRRASEAIYAISLADLRIEFVRLTDPDGEGIVVDQNPIGGSTVRRGSTVTVQAIYDSPSTPGS